MIQSWALVDGGPVVPLEEAVIPVTDPAFTHGWSVFETLLIAPGESTAWEEHRIRLGRSCDRACIPRVPDQILRSEIERVVARVGGVARVRVTLTGAGRRVVQAQPIETSRRHRPVRAVRGTWRVDPILGGDVKHGSRAAWRVAVQRSGVDEVLLVDERGQFLEGTTCGVLAVVDGVLWTAPHDGRVLASTTVLEVIDRALGAGIVVRREGPSAGGPWDGLYVASVTRDLAPVVELDGHALPGWEPIGRSLIQESD